MPNYAVIENGKVVNMCVASPGDEKPDNWVLCEAAGIGWDYIDGKFVDNRTPFYIEPVAPPAPTKEQLLAQLAALQAQIEAIKE